MHILGVARAKIAFAGVAKRPAFAKAEGKPLPREKRLESANMHHAIANHE